jgi:DNA-binding CsgD family transcriptional regulator
MNIKRELADLARRRTELEAIARLTEDLRQLGAEWRSVRGHRNSVQRKGSGPHPVMTRLQAKIRDAVAAGMSERLIARTAGVTRDTVRVAQGV